MSPTREPDNDSTQLEPLLERLNHGDKSAMDELLALLFDDLRRLARSQRARVGGGETLRTTALVHEAYLKMRRSAKVSTDSRHHFMNTAALAMRQVLIDHARSQLAKRNREQALQHGVPAPHAKLLHQAQMLLDVDAAMDRLTKCEPRLATVVNYRYFAGFTEAEIADLLDISERTVRRDWLKAKAWLAEELRGHVETPQ